MKNWLIGKDLDAGKDWRQEEKGTTEHEMVGWHHWLDEHELEEVPGVGDGQGSLACCSPWGCKELDMTELLKWTEAWEKTFLTILIPTHKSDLTELWVTSFSNYRIQLCLVVYKYLWLLLCYNDRLSIIARHLKIIVVA